MKKILGFALAAAMGVIACGAPADPSGSTEGTSSQSAAPAPTKVERASDALDSHGAVKPEWYGACTPAELLNCRRQPDGVGCEIVNGRVQCIFI